MRAYVESWSAWAPSLETRDHWRQWVCSPSSTEVDGTPDVDFVPPLLRRRCTLLSRMMLAAAHDCVGDLDPANVLPVFTSRHGSVNESVGMLKKVASEERVSPTAFAHSVHNAQVALYSLIFGNQECSTAISAEHESFEAGFLESMITLHRFPGSCVLFVAGDVPIVTDFSSLIQDPPGAYAVALLLRAEGVGTHLQFELSHEQGCSKRRQWPVALEFLRWFLSDESELKLGGRRHGWNWKKL